MFENMIEQREKVEDVLLFAAQQVGDTAYEKYIAGEITETDLQRLYNMIRHWTSEGQELLKVLE